jgi:hypothetical protein
MFLMVKDLLDENQLDDSRVEIFVQNLELSWVSYSLRRFFSSILLKQKETYSLLKKIDFVPKDELISAQFSQ